MICEAAGIVKYGDKGNMTKAEIDKTIDFLIKTKKDGQFRAFWKTFDEIGQPDGLGRGGDPVDVVAGRRRGARQGHRPASTSRSRKAIAPGAAASASPSTCQGAQLDAAYEYINWYTVGLGRRATSTARATTRRCSTRPRPT